MQQSPDPVAVHLVLETNDTQVNEPFITCLSTSS